MATFTPFMPVWARAPGQSSSSLILSLFYLVLCLLVAPRNRVFDGGHDRMNPFASVTRSAMRPIANLLWTLVYVYFVLQYIVCLSILTHVWLDCVRFLHYQPKRLVGKNLSETNRFHVEWGVKSKDLSVICWHLSACRADVRALCTHRRLVWSSCTFLR